MSSIVLAGRHGSGLEQGGHFVDGHDTQQDTMAELVSEKVLLHGTLEVCLKEAKNLPNMDMFSEKFRQLFSYLTVCKAPFVKAKSKVEEKGDFGFPLWIMDCVSIFLTVDYLCLFPNPVIISFFAQTEISCQECILYFIFHGRCWKIFNFELKYWQIL